VVERLVLKALEKCLRRRTLLCTLGKADSCGLRRCPSSWGQNDPRWPAL